MQPMSGRGRRGQSASEPRHLWVHAESILDFARVVSDLRASEAFYGSALGFHTVSRGPLDPPAIAALGLTDVTAHRVSMRLGEEALSLVQFDPPGRAYPADSRSNDLWFQHVAIVVSDMDAAYAQLCSNDAWRPISTDGPQTLPASSGGVRAFKFRDPDGHPLELLWMPPGSGGPQWHRAGAAGPGQLFLGIDHSALAVSSTRRSLAFYRSLGLQISRRSLNSGPAQSRLDDLRAAQVRVTGLRPAAAHGPGLELLAYRPTGRAGDCSSATDLSTGWITLGAISAGTAPAAAGASSAGALRRPGALSDPDGHRFLLVDHRVGSSGRPA